MDCALFCICSVVFLCKQETAYELRISDWSADVCASDLSGVDRVRSAIAQASRRTGMDFGYLYKQARIESGLRPDAKARTSSATGLYQFIDQSWLAALK